MLTVIAFIIILGILVLAHELGHFVSAIKLGVEVEEFGVGFPPRIFSFKRKGIIYSINWIPIGGFVKIKGESGGDKDEPGSFVGQSVWKKSIILSAGVLMNFAVAFILFAIGFYVGLPQTIDDKIPLDRISDRNIMIMQVLTDSPASSAGINIGDKILTINQQSMSEADDVYQFITEHGNEELSLTVKRNEETKDFQIQPQVLTEGELPILGVALADVGTVHYNIGQSIWQGLRATVLMTGRVVMAFYQLIANLVTEGKLAAELSGPVGVAIITGQVIKMGWIYILQFTAILSINLGVINILPFPALDGGRLLMVWVEKITGRRLKERTEALIHNSGFFLLILLLIFITWRDISRYGSVIWQAIKNVF